MIGKFKGGKLIKGEEIMDKIKRMKLEAKVQVYMDKKRLPDYTVVLVQETGKEVSLEIIADKTTCGRWTWYLSTLLKDTTRSDMLYLDWEQEWFITGMEKVYQEVIAKYQIPS